MDMDKAYQDRMRRQAATRIRRTHLRRSILKAANDVAKCLEKQDKVKAEEHLVLLLHAAMDLHNDIKVSRLNKRSKHAK